MVDSDVDYVRVMFGERAVHVPGWMYVQDQGDGTVSFVGASRVDAPGGAHPLRFGSQRAHQLVVGELIVRPHFVIGTDARRGEGLGALVTNPGNPGDPESLLAQGEWVLPPRV